MIDENKKALNEVVRRLINGVKEHIAKYGNPYDFQDATKRLKYG